MIVIKFLLERPVKQRVLGSLFNYLIKRVLMGVPSSQLTTNFLAKIRFSTCVVRRFLYLDTHFVDILFRVPQCYLYKHCFS